MAKTTGEGLLEEDERVELGGRAARQLGHAVTVVDACEKGMRSTETTRIAEQQNDKQGKPTEEKRVHSQTSRIWSRS